MDPLKINSQKLKFTNMAKNGAFPPCQLPLDPFENSVRKGRSEFLDSKGKPKIHRRERATHTT